MPASSGRPAWTGAAMTVGATAAKVDIQGASALSLGMRLLCRADNSGNVFISNSSDVTVDTGILLPKGDRASATPFTIPEGHFDSGGEVWLIADTADQVVDWDAF